jgi:hypothetical protein
MSLTAASSDDDDLTVGEFVDHVAASHPRPVRYGGLVFTYQGTVQFSDPPLDENGQLNPWVVG